MKISFIGYGNMAKSIAKILMDTGQHQLVASAPSLQEGSDEIGVITTPNNLAVLSSADIVILAVKPKQMSAVIEQIKGKIPDHCLFVSIAAGLSLSWFKSINFMAPVVRAMPNIPCAIGLGATPLVANSKVTPEQKSKTEIIFQALGLMTWVDDESLIDAFTALSGSGPAYVFLFLEAMIEAATSLGIDQETAKYFALQTVSGASKLAEESSIELNTLRKQVTSPGGTTEAALNVLEDHAQLRTLIKTAMTAAVQQAKKLGKS